MKTPKKNAFRERHKAEKDAALLKQDLVNSITIEYLQNQIKTLEAAKESLKNDACKTGDPEVWDCFRVIQGEINMCREIIKYAKGLSYREFCFQINEGKL